MRARSFPSASRAFAAAAGFCAAFLTASSAAVPAVPAVQSQGPCDTYPAGATSSVLHNRATMLFMGGSIPDPADPHIGAFEIDDLGHRASLRFTSPVVRTVSSVWIYLTAVKGAPGPLRVSVKDDLDGLPAVGGVSESTTFLPTYRGWIQVLFPPGARKVLQACGVYHVEIEPAGAPYNALNFVQLVAAVNRFPLQWQARDPGQTTAQSVLDFELAFFFDGGEGDGLTVRWDPGNIIYAPVFLVECTDGSTLGQPYNDHVENVVLGNVHYGQSFTVDATLPGPVHLNYLAMFVRGRGGFQDDQLYGYLYDTVTHAPVPNSTTLLVDPPAVINRSHWFGGVFPGGGVNLVSGRQYYAVVKSDNLGPHRRGYEFSSERTTIPLAGGVDDPTYGSSDSHVVFSPNGGNTFFGQAGEADAAFMLANLTTPVRAVGCFDEGVVMRAGDGQPAHTAEPGELLEFHMQTRNMGVVAGDLFLDIVDVASGESILAAPEIVFGVPPNTDAATGTHVFLPAREETGIWKLDLRVGYRPAPGQYVLDDVKRFEVRVQ